MDKIQRIKELVQEINYHKDLYYNKNRPEISDQEFDKLVDQLEALEKETGIIMSNSPTQTVGYEVKSELKKIKHSHPMLSLAKTKNIIEFSSYCGNKPSMVSLKMDGLSILITYENGQLVLAETRGNGEIGEDVTSNIKAFENVPLIIPYKDHFEIEGEAIITYEDFKKINAALPKNERYSNPRNLVSGSVRQLNASITAKRYVKFIAWKVPGLIKIPIGYNPNNFADKLLFAEELGFEIVPFIKVANDMPVDLGIIKLKTEAKERSYPYDGFVHTFLDVKYGESLGNTGHHPKHSFVLKEQDEEYETVLRDIVWQVGKSGIVSPVAVFDPVDLGGAVTSKASVHNVSILTKLDLQPGDIITVYRSNMVIPQIRRNISAEGRVDSSYIKIPSFCPVCGGKTEIKRDNDSDVLICTNPNCKGKLLGKLKHFCSKDAMDIQGLSEQTLQRFINCGYIKSIPDLYRIGDYQRELRMLDGFGATSINNLLNAIETSKHTTLDRFINALSIPNIGKETAKMIAKHFNYNWISFGIACNMGYNWQKLPDFGGVMQKSLEQFWKNNKEWISDLGCSLDFYNPYEQNKQKNVLKGQVFVITGKLLHFKNRDELVQKIEECGGKVAGSVSKNTDYLINNDVNSNSGKNKKAKELGVKIISEDEFMRMIE
jgi:DNA ligase (NAD+)